MAVPARQPALPFSSPFSSPQSSPLSTQATQPGEATPKLSGPPEYSPSEINHLASQTLKREFPPVIRVRGELSDYKPAPSGHRYFNIKDARGVIACTMWAAAAAHLKFEPQSGMEIIASGGLEIYVKAGKFQMSVTRLEPAGQGAMDLAKRELIQRLQVAGLLDRLRLPLPRFPRRIALVTSPQAAGYADMRKVFANAPQIELLLLPVRVQGDGAASDVSAAILILARNAKKLGIDLIVVARGGGSTEDLWPFNDEAIVKAILSSSMNYKVPVVTGIGHETDTHVADLVSDYHAHTPTEAAAVISRSWRDAPAQIDTLARSLRSLAHQRVASTRRHFDLLANSPALRDAASAVAAVVSPREQELDELDSRLDRSLRQVLLRRERWLTTAQSRLDRLTPQQQLRQQYERLARLEGPLRESLRLQLYRNAMRIEQFTQRLFRPENLLSRPGQKLDVLESRLEGLSPLAILSRGYSITTRAESGEVVRDASDAAAGTLIRTRLAKGEIQSSVS